MVDVNRADLDNLLASEDNSEDNGNDSININTLLQQLLSATTNLQSSVNEVNVTIHEMKQHQTDMQSKIDHIENVVFSADLHGTRFNKPKIGHDSDAMNEDSMQVDGANNATTSGGKDYSPTNEVCFKALTPPNFKCIDPSCVRIHDKNKIHEMMSKNLKDMMESRSSMHSTEEASLDAVHHDLEANTADHSP